MVWRRAEPPVVEKAEKKQTNKGRDVKLWENRVIQGEGRSQKGRKVKNALEGKAREGKD